MIIAGNIVSWYLLHNIGDRISFINDTEDNQMLFGNPCCLADFSSFKDVTLKTINELIEAEILRSNKGIKAGAEEYISGLILNNIWDPALTGNS